VGGNVPGYGFILLVVLDWWKSAKIDKIKPQ
jgi:hypothetical protein